MNFEKDEIYGTTERRTLAYTRPRMDEPTAVVRPVAPTVPQAPKIDSSEPHPFGPEAVERAQMMAYERTRLIQQESPYVSQEVVEHKVHDFRLYVGMWIVAGISAVAAFLTFSLVHVLVAAVAVVFALTSTPGDQYRDSD